MAAIAAAAFVGASLASCSSSPSATTGIQTGATKLCALSKSPVGPVTVNGTSSTSPTGVKLVIVPVCIDGRGPIPFVVDTGQAITTVNPQVADRLHLHSSGTVPLGASACSVDAPAETVASWSVGGLSLAPQQVASADLPNLDVGGDAIGGLLGSDVLGRFGAVRIDYRTDQMTVVAPEAAAPTKPTIIQGEAAKLASPTLVVGTPRAVIPLTVVESPTGSLASAPVTFGGRPAIKEIISSGAVDSTVDTSVVNSVRLAPAGSVGPPSGVGCPASVPQYRSGSWAIGSVQTAPTTLGAVNYATVGGQVADGTVGADVLTGYGSFVLDYGSAQLVLGGS